MTMTRFHPVRLAAVLLLAGAVAVPSSAYTVPDSFALGRDSDGDPCVATRTWTVGKDIKLAQDQSFTMNCRGSAQSRGYVEVPSARSMPGDTAVAGCGDPRRLSVTGLGEVEARRCFDPRLALEAVELRISRPRGIYRAVAAPGALGPLEAMARVIVAGASPPTDRAAAAATSITVSAIPPVPPGAMPPPIEADAAQSGLTAQAALEQGLSLIYSGRYVEASRLLNDAVSQFAGAPASQRAELRINAALADSNIGEFEAAQQHFNLADTLLASVDPSDAKSNLENVASTYRALDLINRAGAAGASGEPLWRQALTTLDARSTGAAFPLKDPLALAQVNQGGSGGVTASVEIAQSSQMRALAIEARQWWARSTAHLALGELDRAQATLDNAIRSTAALQRNVPIGSIAWLRAGIERQQGRIHARRKDLPKAIASFDCAIATLGGGPAPAGSNCLFAGVSQRGTITGVAGPTVAEMQIEQATLLAGQASFDRATVVTRYEMAVSSLSDNGGTNGSVPPSLGRYLDLLVPTDGSDPAPDAAEHYFKAMQIGGEPAIAREVAELKSAVTAQGPVAAMLRERDALEQERNRLRYRIAGKSAPDAATPPAGGDQATLADLEKQQATATAQLEKVKSELLGAHTYSALDDDPATIAQIRPLLRPDELYLKLVAVGSRMYGIAIAADRTWIYALDRPAQKVDALAASVLGSARSYVDKRDNTVRIPRFKVADANILFQTIAGPAADRMASDRTRSIILDLAGTLRAMPAAMLVTDPASVASFAAQSKRNDYSQVAFLGSRADIATALSPRSFLLVRGTPPAAADHKRFIGFGETAPAKLVPAGARQPMVTLNTGCRIDYDDWAERANGNPPIPAREMRTAAIALGDADAPIITGARFTDTYVMDESEANRLSGYQVIHFATHGIAAQPFKDGACNTVLPPSLVTTLAPPTAADTASDGLLSFVEVAKLRLDANLVVLSACDTASGVSAIQAREQGQIGSSATLDGLVRAFITARARAVVATYWEVPATTGTQELIDTFYQEGRTATIGAALRKAQLRVMKAPGTSHPYFWAAFFLVGDGAKTMLTAPGTKTASATGL